MTMLVNGPSPRYLTCAETAKLLRGRLKAEFPGVKFSVRSDVYSMGASINVSWWDGPPASLVNAIAKQYEGEWFDGMTDSSHSIDRWLYPDGSMSLAHSRGPDGHFGDPERAGAELVSPGSDYVFLRRKMSRGLP